MVVIMDEYVEILSLRASGLVSRWHTVPTLHRQNVAEHSGQAVSLLLMLHPKPSLNLIKAMMWHDSAERHCGDVPAPVRKENQALSKEYELSEIGFTHEHHPTAYYAQANLTVEERAWLKAIDVLELILYCQDEVTLGNGRFGAICARAEGYLKNSHSTPVEVLNFLDWFNTNRTRSFA